MQRPPNVVLILADDLGIGDLSCTGPGSRIRTPHHDRLAAEGRRYDDCHSGSAVCTPTRYGLLTGRYCWRTRLRSGVLHGPSGSLIEPGRPTLASLLNGVGYATACIGKWHLGLGWRLRDGSCADLRADDPAITDLDYAAPLASGPHSVGFDRSFIIPASLDMAPYLYVEDGRVAEIPDRIIADSPRPAFWRGGPIAPGFEHRTCLLEITRRAEAWLMEQTPQRPFFLYLPLPSPHTPHTPREPFVGASGLGPYGDLVVEHDWSLGRILAALDRRGLADDTLVIATSDNGAHSQPLGLEALGHRCNGPWRGQKSDAWDGGHRVPFLARWPDRIAAGSVHRQTFCLTDLLPTLAGLAGVRLPAGAGDDGFALPGLLDDRPAAARPAPVIHHSIRGNFAVRDGRWKLIACAGSGGWSQPEDQVPAGAPTVQLYDLDADPAETCNLATAHPEVVRRLQAEIARQQAGPSAAP